MENAEHQRRVFWSVLSESGNVPMTMAAVMVLGTPLMMGVVLEALDSPDSFDEMEVHQTFSMDSETVLWL